METREERMEQWQKQASAQNQRLLWCVFGVLMLFPLGQIFTAWQRDNVLAAVVRAQSPSSIVPVIFLSIDGADPSNAFINRFKRSSLVVRKASQAIDKSPPNAPRLSPPSTILIDTASGQRGVKLELDRNSIQWRGPFWGKVAVNFPGAGYDYSVVLTPLGWICVGKKMSWIS